jgi:adenylate kinase family enzyme
MINPIFVHGPSGSGKGELAKVLISSFELLNYQVFYGASGDFFRNAMAKNPTLAIEMASGKYIDSLYPIRSEIEALAYKWRMAKDGGVMILDGVIRRGNQIDQMAEFLELSRQEILDATHIAINAHPDDQYSQLMARNTGRSDDHEAAVRKRMSNWTDFARLAVACLGYKLEVDGSLSSDKSNLLTLNNGAYYGIGLEQFRQNCRRLQFLIY